MTQTAGWYHCSVKTMSRSAGRSVVAAAAYRLGERLHEQEVDQTHDYRRRSGVAGTFTCAPSDAPAWAHEPERLWNAANAAENRKNSTLAREVELALPAAVSAEAREGIARAFSQHLVERYGVTVSGAIHEPGRQGDQRNHHAHILFTTRAMGPDGLGAKTRILDAKATGAQEIAHLRAIACDLINAALAEAGSDERVDHRSFAARGIDAEPTEHLGPAASAMERRGEASERGAINTEATARNEQRDELASVNAAILTEQERQRAAPVTEPDPLPPPASQGEGFAERARRALSGLFKRNTASPPESRPALDAAPPSGGGLAASLPVTDSAEAEATRQWMAEFFGEGRAAPVTPEPDAPASTPDQTAADFAEIHAAAIAQARADMAMTTAEEATDDEAGYRRYQAWWGNMRAHFVGWHDDLQDRLDSFFHPRWDAPDPPRHEPHEPDRGPER